MLVAKPSLTLADELPITKISGEKHWTENYCYIAYDFQSQVGLYLHIGRWLQDPGIWREMVYVYLPDGTTLNYRSLGGRYASSRGPQGALVRYDYSEPNRWDVKFRGPTNHMTREQMLCEGPHPERVMELMDMEATFTGGGPVLQYEIEDNSSIGRWHYEQEMLLNATVRFRGETYRMNAAQGWRDHTRGPRWLGDTRAHINIQAKLPDGRSINAFQVWMDRDGEEYQLVDEGRITKGSSFRPARIVEATRLDHKDNLPKDIRLVVEAEGERIELVGQPVNLMIYSNTPTFEILYGFAPKAAPWVCFNQPVAFRYRNQIIGGCAERTIQYAERCTPAPK